MKSIIPNNRDENIRVEIDGQHYEFLFTTRALKEVTVRFGGIKELFETMTNFGGNNAEAYDVTIWLICLLANQSILLHNLKNPQDKKELLTAEYIELMCVPADLMKMSPLIGKAINRGMVCAIPTDAKPESESDDSEDKKKYKSR